MPPSIYLTILDTFPSQIRAHTFPLPEGTNPHIRTLMINTQILSNGSVLSEGPVGISSSAPHLVVLPQN